MSNEYEPATKKDLAELAADLTSKMATKDDLARMATKDDLAELAADLTSKMATKDDLAELAADLTSKMATKDDLARMATKDDLARMATKDDLAELAADLRKATKDDLAKMEQRMMVEIGHIVNVVIEQIGDKVAVIDEKYDGPVRQLRADLDAHRADSSLHPRLAPSAPKRVSRRKPLSTR